MVEILGVSLDPTVDLGRVDYNFKLFKDGDRWHGHSWRHRLVDGTRFFFRYSLMFSHSNLFSFFFISGNSMPYISCSKSGSVSGFLVLSHSFQNVQSCTRNHSVPQITVSVVRQMAHNMHIAYITSCIHVKLKIATMLYHCWLYAMPRTCNYNMQWVRDTSPLREKRNLIIR